MLTLTMVVESTVIESCRWFPGEGDDNAHVHHADSKALQGTVFICSGEDFHNDISLDLPRMIEPTDGLSAMKHSSC